MGAERHFTCFRRQSARRCPRDRRSVLDNALPVLLWPGRDEARGEVRVADSPLGLRVPNIRGGTRRGRSKTVPTPAAPAFNFMNLACASSAFWRLFWEAETRARARGFLMKNVGRFPRFWYFARGAARGRSTTMSTTMRQVLSHCTRANTVIGTYQSI